MLSIKQWGQSLLDEEIVNAEQWDEITQLQQENPDKRVSEILIEKDYTNEQELIDFFSRHFEMTILDLNQFTLDKATASLLPGSLCAKFNVLPVGKRGQTLVVAMADPSNIQVLDQIRFQTRLKVEPVLALPSSIRSLVERYYGMDVVKLSSSLERVKEDLEGSNAAAGNFFEEVKPNAEVENLGEDELPIVEFVSILLTDAIRKKASDVHVEPYENDIRIRFRIDGQLSESLRPPSAVKQAVIARIKVMAQMRLDEKRLPQDGRIRFRMPEGKVVDFRVNTLPTVFGEKVVIRILDKSSAAEDLADLGFEKDDEEKFKKAIHFPWGMCLVTGATGSGKTTTLYSALNRLNSEEVNISTIEDPVEYNFMGMNQCQIKESIGYTFAKALRAMLRQDPDIILLGEIRDSETAEIAMKAALTGHLVLSTLHTNDAPSTVVRLKDLNIESFLINSAVRVVVAQRLVRKICSSCKEIDERVTEKDLQEAGFPEKALGKFQAMKGKGCNKCQNSGTRGRIAVFEVMPISEKIREIIGSGGNADAIRKQAMREGMRSLKMNCMRKIVRGEVALEELKTLSD